MSAWTHPTTNQRITRAAVDQLIARFRTSSSARQRQAIERQLLALGVALREITADLERRLVRGDAVLQASPDPVKEERWLEWLASFEGACDAVAAIQFRALSDQPASLTQRREA